MQSIPPPPHYRGFFLNNPLYPYTSDEVYGWAFDEVVPPLIEAFRPDALVTQIGIDSHFKDPITHLMLTVQGFGQRCENSHRARLQNGWLSAVAATTFKQ